MSGIEAGTCMWSHRAIVLTLLAAFADPTATADP
jgi:hypothetical protein